MFDMIELTLAGEGQVGQGSPTESLSSKQAEPLLSPGDLCPTWQSWGSTHLGQEPAGLRSQRLGPLC